MGLCANCGYEMAGLSGPVCPECGRSGPPAVLYPTRHRTAVLGGGMVVTHNLIILAMGHGAVPIGLAYGYAITHADFGPYGYRLAPILAGVAGTMVGLVAWAAPQRLVRELALGLSSILLMWAWLYFGFRVMEGRPEFMLIESLPFLGFVAVSAWQIRRLWWIW